MSLASSGAVAQSAVSLRARQLVFMGDLLGAVGLLGDSLADDAEQPGVWLLLADLLGAASSGGAVNPSGLETRGGCAPIDSARSAEAYAEAYHRGRRSTSAADQDTAEAARENLQGLLRRCLGHSAAVLMESLWDADRSAFVVAEARRASADLRSLQPGGRLVACVVDGAGWEGAWLSRHAGSLGLLAVYSVRGPRTAALASCEAAVAAANDCHVTCTSWHGLASHLEAARPTALLAVMGSCLGAYPVPPAAVLAEVKQLQAAMPQVGSERDPPFMASFVPAVVQWHGGPAAGALLRSSGRVDAAQFRQLGLDFAVAEEVMRPRHAWLRLDDADGATTWEARLLMSLRLREAWAAMTAGGSGGSTLEAKAATLADGPGENPPMDAVFWWTSAESEAEATTTTTTPATTPTTATTTATTTAAKKSISCAPKQRSLGAGGPGGCRASGGRTWQAALFGNAEELLGRDVTELLAIPAAEGGARFRPYHVSMLNDGPRTACYDALLREAVHGPKISGEPLVALDLGAGTGLLSMLLARRAQEADLCESSSVRIVSVEAEAALAGLARRLVAANGLSHLVEVHHTLSTELGPGLPAPPTRNSNNSTNTTATTATPTRTDLGSERREPAEDRPPRERANLCVHEVFGSDPLSERLLPSLRHARREELLAEDCRLVPSHLTLLCALCRGPRLQKAFTAPASVEGVRGVGEAFEAFGPVVEAFDIPKGGGPSDAVSSQAEDIEWLSHVAEIATLDLWKLSMEAPIELPVVLHGRADPVSQGPGSGIWVGFWFRIEGPVPQETMDPGGVSRPWAPVFQRLCAAGDAQNVVSSGSPFVADLVVRLAEDRVRCRLKTIVLEDSPVDVDGLAGLFDGM
ncbi:unnamed protein product [Polarella glacialis]|uniref:type I protein arginine methyltransferase n=1 Tax=Polarella glacialis TaxID=89957 RepID=A0A813LE96_POLGL|nr:unnamed protein product [Polarella glacialis]